jgi:2-dehydro-3-deoxyphosphogluconate aldolase / (4S)-4-hydroxy-2-oxoglutarate aldolase
MTEKEPILLPRWLYKKVLPVIRTSSPEEALWIAHCLHQVGASVLEFTLTIPDVWQVYQQFQAVLAKSTQTPSSYLKIGMGSLKSVDDLEVCLSKQVDFTASPGFIPHAYERSQQAGHCHLGGAITPSELNQVIREGGQCVKLFPIAPLGGVRYFKTVTTPFPELVCIPFGGISPEQVPHYLQAGAVCVGLGSQLMPPAGWFQDNRSEEYMAFLKNTRLF